MKPMKRSLRLRAYLRYVFDVNMIYLAETIGIIFVFAVIILYRELNGEEGSIFIVIIIIGGVYLTIFPILSSALYWGSYYFSKGWRARYDDAESYEDLLALGQELRQKFPSRRR